MLRLARNVGWIEPGSFVDNANYLGMVAFLLIMNSAISWRYTDMRAEKEAAQAEALRVAHQAERDLELQGCPAHAGAQRCHGAGGGVPVAGAPGAGRAAAVPVHGVA
ncbi:hypothetical protein ACU4HD_22700 [Cupriavidus basilensis]